MFGRLKTSLKNINIQKVLSPTAKVEKVCETHCAENLRDGDMRHALPKAEDIYKAQVVICTTSNSHRINNLKGFNDATSEGFHKTFNNVIIDEAAFAPESILLIPIVRNIVGGQINFRLVLVGDPHQLNQNPRSAIFGDISQVDIMSRINKTLEKFSNNHHMLKNNYRSSITICRLLNKLVYNDQLVCMNKEKGKITLIHAETSKTSMDSKSKFSIPEASATIRYIKLKDKENENFRILSYYNAHQVKILEEAQEQQCRNISVSTVEAVQGLEGKTIVINTTLPRVNNAWQLSKRRLNVIISRSQRDLVIVGDLTDLISHPLFKQIIEEAILCPRHEIFAPTNIRKLMTREKYDRKQNNKKQRKVI